MIEDRVEPTGDVEIICEWLDGRQEVLDYHNTVLLTGRRALAKCLGNVLGGSFQFYITRMIFGDGGTTAGVKKFVNAGREGLFGVTRLTKPTIATLDTSVPAQIIFTSVIKFDEAVDATLNEMALQMANGELYSLVTFPDLTKTEEMQITFNWRLNFV